MPRPISLSEGHIPNKYSEAFIPDLSPIESPPEPEPEPDSESESTSSILPIVRGLAIRFSLHLFLISLFETLFFWMYISRQEDSALESLIDTYVEGAFSNCSSYPLNQRILFVDFVNNVLNQSTILENSQDAYRIRTAFNSILFRNSWLYVGGLGFFFSGFAVSEYRYPSNIQLHGWIGEHLGMIAMLGFYEWMFFSTVVLRYQTITPAELDMRVVKSFYADCLLL